MIAANCRPFDELLDGNDGICINDEDEYEVSRVVTALLNDPARRRAMGEYGRARVLAEFQWDKVAAQYVALVESTGSSEYCHLPGSER